MKKVVTVISILLTIAIVILLIYYSRPWHAPDSGVWYCEELSMSIDFANKSYRGYIVQWYNEDNEYEELTLVWGNGGSICVYRGTEHEWIEILVGTFERWKQGKDFIINDYYSKKSFVFKEANETTLSK